MSTPKLLFTKVAIGCDHAAVSMKNDIRDYLKSLGVTVVDVGTHSTDRVDYPDIAEAVCKLVTSKEVEVGILFCGTGIGISMAANKCHGIRAGLIHDYYTAVMTREHNDANVMCAGARVTGIEVVKQAALAFLSTPFQTEGNHKLRVAKITALEASQK